MASRVARPATAGGGASRAAAGSGAAGDGDSVNVQVILRCRPANAEEKKARAPTVVKCAEASREVHVSQTIAGKTHERTFHYDKVFGPQSEQAELYETAVTPIVDEVLSGYTCAIFAYGQTGTGKTFTMEGGIAGAEKTYVKDGALAADAGVIPRSVKQIFETLEANGSEYSVKVTFLELYNEEITDLLGADTLDDKRKLALLEDSKGFVTVRGLEEVIVKTPDEIFDVLNRGTAKRRTAETKLNKQSSRSHSVFSVTIHMKESTPDGEDVIKVGRLNLVDLAGSENIGRSGAKDSRAREAGEINKSLLTLGRVISALVEKQPHVPYRDSKLTRMLRDSLGGRTKTCIIATVAPSVNCLEETLSTLDYAHRAKNIKNKPEVNQRVTKTTLIKDMTGEIDRLRRDLLACREKNGVYINAERYAEEQAERKKLDETVLALEQQIEEKEEELAKVQKLFETKETELNSLKDAHDQTVCVLQATQGELKATESALDEAHEGLEERDYLIASHERSQKGLVSHADKVRMELDAAAMDVSELFAKVARADGIAGHNASAVERLKEKLATRLTAVTEIAGKALDAEAERYDALQSKAKEAAADQARVAASLRSQAAAVATAAAEGAAAMASAASAASAVADGARTDAVAAADARGAAAVAAAKAAADAAAAAAEALTADMCKHEESLKAFAKEVSDQVGADSADAAGEAEAFAATFEADAAAEQAELLSGIEALVASFVTKRAEAVRAASAHTAAAVRSIGAGANCKLAEMMTATVAGVGAMKAAVEDSSTAAAAAAAQAADADSKASAEAQAAHGSAQAQAADASAAFEAAHASAVQAVEGGAGALEGAIGEAQAAAAGAAGELGAAAAEGKAAAAAASARTVSKATEVARSMRAFELKSVKPTGMTPQRRAYAVPREGAAAKLATADPAVVLEEFRASKRADGTAAEEDLASPETVSAAAVQDSIEAAAEGVEEAEAAEEAMEAEEEQEVVAEEEDQQPEQPVAPAAAPTGGIGKGSRLRAPLATRAANAESTQ